MTVAERGGIFLSYRRQESSHLAGRLYDRLADRFGEGQVFIDVDAIEPGVDFAAEVNRAVANCRVLLAIIGPRWLTAADEHGRRRLDDPDDIVRLEIEVALDRDVRVIPILIEGAVMPGSGDLPEGLAGLARRNAFFIRHESFRPDAGRLVAAIERILAPPGTADAQALLTADSADNEAAPKDPVSVRADPGRAARLLADAEHIARAITEKWHRWRVWALSDVARALAATSPDRSARLFADAEVIASSISHDDDRALALADIASALAAIDSARADRILQLITGENTAHARYAVAMAMAATDPDRAERIAESIGVSHLQAKALTHIAQTFTAKGLDWARLVNKAERTAQAIPAESLWKPDALAVVASALAATDPDRAARLFADAERIGLFTTSEPWRADALANVAKMLAASDPDGATRLFAAAERIAQSGIGDTSLAHVASSLAATDPDRAERIARSITGQGERDSALIDVVSVLAATDPDRAERIAQSVTTDAQWRAVALTDVAVALAPTDLDRAERIVLSIPEEPWKVKAMVTLAEALE